MLTDTVLRNLKPKPKSKIYKASDRDGMYVTVLGFPGHAGPDTKAINIADK